MNDVRTNDVPDPLETELASLRPPEVTLELRQRIGKRLDHSPPSRTGNPWRIALAGGLAAACLVGVLAWWMTNRRDEREHIVIQLESATPVQMDDALPTFLVYSRALNRSPEALDALLDKHAVLGSRPDGLGVRNHILTRFDSEFHSGIGEL